jgi:Cytochrome c biogenesis protein
VNSTVVGYAFTLGMVGVLNPCGFPLLPAYLALFVTGERVDWRSRLLRGVRAGGCVSVGFLVVFLLVGILAASAVTAIIAWVPWLMILIGIGLVGVGIITVAGRPVALHLPALGFRGGRGAGAMIGFGASYALASLSCSLPLFLAGVLGVFTSTSFAGGLAAFAAYALGMGVFVTAAGVATSLIGGTVVGRLRPLVRILPRLAGAIVLIAGGYLVFYWAHELLAPTQRSGVIAAAQSVQNTVSTWIGDAALPLGIAMSCVVVGSLIVLAVVSAHKEAGASDA